MPQRAEWKVAQVRPCVWRLTDVGDNRAFLVVGDEAALLVDTGEGLGDLRSTVEGISTLPLTVVLTHHHHDHVGCAYQFPEVWISASERRPGVGPRPPPAQRPGGPGGRRCATIVGGAGATRGRGREVRGVYDPPDSGPLSGLTPDQTGDLLLRAVLADPKAGGWDPASISNRSKCELGERSGRETGLPLRSTTGFLRISKSSYECWRGLLLRGGPRDRRAEVAGRVEEAFREGGRCARGYRFVHRELALRLGRPVSEKVARGVMRERGLRPLYLRRRRRHGSYAGEVDEAPANLPLRPDGTHDFSASRPNEPWVSDITEFRLPGDPRKVYLSPAVGLFDSRPVAWSVGTSPSAWLAESSPRAACATLSPGEAPVVHTDRGCHYRWPGWKSACAEHGLTRSMSRKGRSPGNAPAEGFFGLSRDGFFRGRDWGGVTAEEPVGRPDGWLRHYREGRARRCREGGRWVWETPDERRRRLGLAV